MEGTDQDSEVESDTVLTYKNHVKGNDPQVDYIFKFKSWKGFDIWLDSIKRKVTHHEKRRYS